MFSLQYFVPEREETPMDFLVRCMSILIRAEHGGLDDAELAYLTRTIQVLHASILATKRVAARHLASQREFINRWLAYSEGVELANTQGVTTYFIPNDLLEGTYRLFNSFEKLYTYLPRPVFNEIVRVVNNIVLDAIEVNYRPIEEPNNETVDHCC